MVHRLITLGTFEERIDEMIKAKQELANMTVSTGESWITELHLKPDSCFIQKIHPIVSGM
jgi:SNF2 family DNA or RNA helicase